MFDPNQFLQQTVTEANSIVREPCPEGEFLASVKKSTIGTWESKDKTKSGLKLDLQWSIDDQDVKAKLDKQEVLVRQTVMLDITDSGALDMGKGKNIGLGRLREALSQNTPGQPWSFSMLDGAGPAKVIVTHRPSEADPSIVYDEIRGVTKPF